MSRKRTLHVQWRSIDGAAVKKRILHLQKNEEGTFTCPIDTCLVLNYSSIRGIRKHINRQVLIGNYCFNFSPYLWSQF